MAGFPFVGPSYQTRSKSFDGQECINMFPVMSESGTSKYVSALYGTPGLRLWSALAGGNVRGLIRFTALLAIAVVGGNVYSLTTAGVGTLIGTIDVADTPVSMASNGTDIMLVTGPKAYVINPTAATVVQLVNSAFTGSDTVWFNDGYFIFNKTGTGQFQITDLYSTVITSLDFATAEGAPDLLLALIVDHREVWLFGETSTEVWYNSGNPDFPYTRIQGAFIETGCAAKFSVAKMDNTVCWLAADDRGQGMIYRANGYQPQRISTEAVEYSINQMSRIDDAIAITYMMEGHLFYQISFPTGGVTWVFDAATNLWHKRAYRDPVTNVMSRHRANSQMAFGGMVLVGDYANGNIYEYDMDTYTDNGDPIARIRICPYLTSSLKNQYFSRLELDMEVGVGLTTGQGSDPQAMLQWSDDGCRTFKNEHWASFGKLGEYRTRVVWRRLGRSRSRAFKVTITDPVKIAILGAELEVTKGTS